MAATQGDNRGRLVAVAAVLVAVIVSGAFVFHSCRPDASPEPSAPLANLRSAAQPQTLPATSRGATTTQPAAGIVGTWTGKWDNIYRVQFTISQDPQDEQYHVVYEWEETLGQPMRRREWPVTERGGTLFSGPIEISLSPHDPNRAIAVGRFRKPRTAELTRQ